MKKKKSLPLILRVIITVSSLLLLTDVALSIILIHNSTERMKKIIQKKCVETASSVAALIDGDEVEHLTFEDKENNTPNYEKNYKILESFKTSSENVNGDLAFVYLLVKTDEGKIVFSIDPSDEPALFLEEEAIYTDALVRTFATGTTNFDTDSYIDRWGNLYSAYAPILDKDDGHVCAVVGADVWASWYDKEVTSNTIDVVLISVVTLFVGVGVSLIATFRIRKRFTNLSNDMNNLETDVKELIKEISDPRYSSSNYTDEENESDSLGLLRGKIHSTQQDLKNYIDFIHAQAYIDSLTGLGNRAAYFEKVKALDERIKNDNFNLFCIVFDINGLKYINDNYGHDNGDKAIRYAAKYIREVLGQDNSFRIGGDEIISIITDINEEELKEKLDRFYYLVKEFNTNDRPVPFDLSVSYGQASFVRGEDVAFNTVFKKADQDMYVYKAKYHQDLKKKNNK